MKKIGYFSMEVGIKNEIPTYSGGLGILAGDSAKAAADLGIDMSVFTLLYNKGNYEQALTKDGWQTERDVIWKPEEHLEKLNETVQIELEGKPVYLNIWEYDVIGKKGTVPVYFLDSNNEKNPDYIRRITDHIYTPDVHTRIFQEAILGIGGLRASQALGLDLQINHLNEGHSAFIIPERINQGNKLEDIIETSVTTTHTPVDAGLERFDYGLVNLLLPGFLPSNITKLAGEDCLNMSYLAINASGYVNAVSKKHAEVSKKLFKRDIDYITNGVHSETWTSTSFKKLLDKYCDGWRTDYKMIEKAETIPLEEIWNAHMTEKKVMIDFIKENTGVEFDPDILTLGFARRAATYKRVDLLFYNIERLRKIGIKQLQADIAGKAHPADIPAKESIKGVFRYKDKLGNDIGIVYVPNHDITSGKVFVAGNDIGLNNPLRPCEASGTSGQKYAKNANPHFSTLDGWWCEGHQEGKTGWSIGDDFDYGIIGTDSNEACQIRQKDANSLYDKLENVIIPMFYNNRNEFIKVMRSSLAINGSYFSADRMMREYAKKAYKIELE